MTTLSFAEWRPDVAGLNAKYAAEINNVLCSVAGYLPAPSLHPLSDAMDDAPTGAFAARNNASEISFFAGTATKLQLLNGTDYSWSDISQTNATYNSSQAHKWRFAQFGLHVLAVNANDDPQVYDLSSSSAFADVSGSPPRASGISVCGDFVFLYGLTDNPSRIQWSGLNDITNWTPGTGNSDYQDFPDGGRVMGVTNTTNPFIIMERAIYQATFLPGSDEIFSFQKIASDVGAASQYSVCSRGGLTFFAGAKGFFQLSADGLVPIGLEKIDSTIFSQIDASNVSNIQGAIDPFFSRIYWTCQIGTAGNVSDIVLIYDWNLQRWTKFSGESAGSVYFSFAGGSLGMTLEGLDDLYASLEALPFSLDSKVWQGGAPIMCAFNVDYKLCFYSGGNSEATLETSEMGDTGGAMTFIDGIYPAIDTDALSVVVGTRNMRSANAVWSEPYSPNSYTGQVDFRSCARFHSFRVTIHAGATWTFAQGLDVSARQAGRR